MAAPVIESYSTADNGNGTGTSLDISAPSGLQSGDFLLVFAGNDADNVATEELSVSGFSKFLEVANGNDAHAACFYKVSDGTETTITVSSVSAQDLVGIALRISGVETTDPFDAYDSISHGFFAQPYSTIIDPDTENPAAGSMYFETTVDDTLVVVYIASDGSDCTNGMTNYQGFTSLVAQSPLNSGDDVGAWTGYYTQATAGPPNGDKRVTYVATDGNARIAVALAPATTPEYELEGYRWRDDNGSESGASWKDSQDTDISEQAGTNVRLRTLIDVTNDPESNQITLQYRKVGDTEWKTVK